MRATGCSWPRPPHHQVTPPAPGPPGALPWPRLRRPSGARCRPLRRSLPRRPGASLSPRRGDSLNGRRRLRRLLPLLLLLLLLLPPRLLGLCAPRNRPPRAALGPAAPARPAGSGGPGKRRGRPSPSAPGPAPRRGSGEPPALCLSGRGRGGRPRLRSDPPAGPPARRPGLGRASCPTWPPLLLPLAAPATDHHPAVLNPPYPGGRLHRCPSHPLCCSPHRVGGVVTVCRHSRSRALLCLPSPAPCFQHPDPLYRALPYFPKLNAAKIWSLIHGSSP